MNVAIEPFVLDGCVCQLNADPREFQALLQQKLTEKINKKGKQLDKVGGELAITGAFTHIDGGNYFLHLMLAFLGKASLTCHVRVIYQGNILIDEPFTASVTCAAFSSPTRQLKADVNAIADQVIKRIVSIVKSFRN